MSINEHELTELMRELDLRLERNWYVPRLDRRADAQMLAAAITALLGRKKAVEC